MWTVIFILGAGIKHNKGGCLICTNRRIHATAKALVNGVQPLFWTKATRAASCFKAVHKCRPDEPESQV